MNIIFYLSGNSIIFFQIRKSTTGVDKICTAIHHIMVGVNRFLSPIVCSLLVKRFNIKKKCDEVWRTLEAYHSKKIVLPFTSPFVILFVCAFFCSSHSLFCLVSCKFKNDILPSKRIFASAGTICDAIFSSFDGRIASYQPIYLVVIISSSLQDYNS